MTRAPWKEETGGPSDGPEPDRAPAYAAEDGEFALYNDYREGTAILRRAPRTTAGELPDGPRGPGRLLPGPRPLVPSRSVEGYGVFTFPYGPISMGVPEAGRFDVRTYGERILDIVPVGGFKSRRIARAVVGRSVADAGLRVERMAGNFAAAHVSAFLQAVESATGTEVPWAELWARGLAQELQRIYNHVHVIARVAEASSQNVGLAQTHALGEELLRLQGELFGHRWLFGALLPGGPARRLEAPDRHRAGTTLARLSAEFETLWALFLESRTFIDRIQATCAVSRTEAVAGGAVGPALRACGVAWDDRLRIPTPPYTDLFVALAQDTGGDALARLVVRAEEVRASFLLIEQLLDRWPSSTARHEAPSPPVAPGRGVGRVEAPSGDLVYDVTVADGRIANLGFRSPSQANWPVFAEGLRNGVFTDFHFAFESFGFAFAETDG